jgi:hypothetical protein
VNRIVSSLRTKRAEPVKRNEDRNFILARFSTDQTDFTRTALDLAIITLPIVTGKLTYPVDGTRGTELTGIERLTAVLGPGATIRGVAEMVAPIFNKQAGTATPLTAGAVATALIQYNQWLLKANPSLWKVGVVLPLPAEIPANNAQVVVNFDAMTALSKKGNGGWDPAKVVADLPIPDPVDITTTVTRNNAAKAADRAVVIANALTTNPFDVVFEAVETIRQYAQTPGVANQPPNTDERAFAEALVNNLSAWQANQLGRLTAGNAMLRRTWRTLRPKGKGATALAERVGTALGLQRDDDGTWHDPTYYFIADQEAGAAPIPVGPSVVPLELRVAHEHVSTVGGASIVATNKAGEIAHDHAMALGRDIDVGRKDEYKDTTQHVHGTEHNGTRKGAQTDPKSWKNAGIVGKDRAVVQQRVDVVVAISPSEGALDAVRTSDKGLLSFGLQQWTVNENDEGSNTLHRFRQLFPDHFDLHFGLYGLQTVLTGRTELADPEGVDLQKAKLANPHWPSSSTFDVGAPTFATFRKVSPNVQLTHARTKLPPGPDRAAYFGAVQPNPNDITVFMINDWAARARLACLGSRDFQRNQMEFGSMRVDRIADEVGPHNVDARTTKTLQELFNSEWAIGVLLDTHFAVPKFVGDSINVAVARTNGSPFTPVDPNAVNGMSRDWLDRFIVNYAVARKVPDHLIGNRNQTLFSVHDKPLSNEPGSFKAW